MANLSIKDVPDAWAEALRQRAARHHRSLQGELMYLLEQAVGASDPSVALERWGTPAAYAPAGPARARIVGYDRRGHPIVRQGWKPPEQVIAELRARDTSPVQGQPLGVDILRQDRDAR